MEAFKRRLEKEERLEKDIEERLEKDIENHSKKHFFLVSGSFLG